MANKYIRHGATYCGDGTSPDLATSNGAPGAWNNINILEGTTPPYGTLAAGDVVYIRSKDESGASITRTLTASVTLGSAAATMASPITWVIDDGTVWAGIDGVIEWFGGTSTYTVTFRSYNKFISSGGKRKYSHRSTSTSMPDSGYVMLQQYCDVVGLLCDWSLKTGTGSPALIPNGYNTISNAKITIGKPGANQAIGMVHIGSNVGNRVFNNLEVEILAASANAQPVICQNGVISLTSFIGGRIYGTGATTGQPLINVSGSTSASYVYPVVIEGLSYPKTMDVISSGSIPQSSGVLISILGMDGGLGAHFERDWGYVTSRTDNNPPTLSATFPDTALTPWSWRMWPRNTSLFNPAILDITTVWQGTDGIRTLTLDFLTEQTFSPGPTKGNTWLDVTYVDSTGVQRTETTLAHLSTTPCEASSAAWSATSWGASVFSKYKITMTTAYAVKQNTAITVSFRTTLKAANSLQILFVDPEVKVS